jgi:hypothetical protein
MISSNGGLGPNPVSLNEGKGRGHKSFIAKSQYKARIDMAAGKQISIYRVLRSSDNPGMGYFMKILSFNCRGLVSP